MATLRSPFRYDFVGSFLRPQAIKTARAEFKAGEITGARLASIHNLRFLLRMMEDIRAAIAEDRLEEYRSDFYNRYDMSRNF